MIKNDEIIEFYNTHGFDGVKPRHREIIRGRGLKHVIKNGGRAIDIGCGLGVMTHHLAQCGMAVIGIDISDKQIEYANKNFSHENATYVCNDFIEYAKTDSSIFDLIVLCDVFEHIEESRLPEFISSFMRLTDTKSKIYMNVPDGRFSSFMREKCPESLQIIDVSHSIHSILGMFSEFGFGPLGIKIYGVRTRMQYNEIMFWHDANVRLSQTRSWER